MKTDFRGFLITTLQKRYGKIFGQLINIFNKIDIKRLISMCKKSVFSTEDEFKKIRKISTVVELFQFIAQYCRGIYDYEVLISVIEASQCLEDKELTKSLQNSILKELTKLQQNSILKELDLMSEFGTLLHPDDFMPKITYKFIVEYDGSKCTIETKEMVLGIIKQWIDLKHGTLTFKNVEVGSIIRFVFQVSGGKTVRRYLLQLKLSELDVRFLEENRIISLIIDGVRIMGSSLLNKVCITALRIYTLLDSRLAICTKHSELNNHSLK